MNSIKKILFVLLLASACKKPTENLKVVVDTDIIKYTSLIQVTDAANGVTIPNNATLSVGGSSADDIYEISGKKQFKLTNGIITIGPGPAFTPVTNKPVSYTIQITAPGYNSVSQTITFTVDNEQQVINIYLVKSGTTVNNMPTPKPQPVYDAVTLNFTGTCTNRTDLEIRPSVYVFYRESGFENPYQYLGYMNKGNITVTALAKGKIYDFQLTYGNKNYSVTQLINQTNYDLKINMGTVCDDY